MQIENNGFHTFHTIFKKHPYPGERNIRIQHMIRRGYSNATYFEDVYITHFQDKCFEVTKQKVFSRRLKTKDCYE